MADSISRFSTWKFLGVSFAVTLGVWLIFSWPLPRFFCRGLPTAAHAAAADVQPMIPGDHLQFMYYCWLAGDFVAGQTPLFYNLYEFNTGDDRERFEPDTYYFPFSLLYALGAWLGGRACGWNLTGFISLWLTYLLTWLLVRRWTSSELIAAAAALLAIALPFRWINLFGGSPAGFALAWVSAILLGVDLAVSEDRVRGGVLAGAALLLASWGDRHVFFFSTLAAPVWGAIVLAGRTDFQWRQGAGYWRLVKALLPIGLFVIAALLFPMLMKWLYRAVIGAAPVAHAIEPRSLREIMIYSPDWRGFLGLSKLDIAPHIYLGGGLLLFLAAGWLALARRTSARREPLGRATSSVEPASTAWRAHGRTLIMLTLIGLMLLAIMVLALGPRGPGHGLFFKLVRALIPPYALIRQPAKIFCLMPSLLALAAALALTALAAWRGGRAATILLAVIFSGFILWDYARRCHPTISLLEKKQAAYAAVSAEATAEQAVARALVLPLWPGDTHYASIYQYFASLYRVRMVNGYNPFIKQGYFENVFRRFESVNQGGLSDEQADELRKMDVRYILLHENLFPEKVSPFPVTATLFALLRHPRLELLQQDGSVWAFKILQTPRAPAEPFLSANILFPARHFEMERATAEHRVTVKTSGEVSGRAFVALEQTNESLRTPPTRVAGVSNLHYLVRARGQGTLGGELLADELSTTLEPISVQTNDWTWLKVPVPDFSGFAALSLKLSLQTGQVDLDSSLITAGLWPLLQRGESLTLPAALFFHAGHLDLSTAGGSASGGKSASVIFRSDYDPHNIVLYGPKLPLPRGTYEATVAFSSPAMAGTPLGTIKLEQVAALPGGSPGRSASAESGDPTVPLIAGQAAQLRWRQYENLPFNLVLVYAATADLEIRQITIARLK